MPPIVMYTKPGCPYCASAKDLLRGKKVKFEEIVAYADPQLRAQMVERSGGRNTFPQIFIGDRHIGGSDDLYALDRAGELDRLLREE